MKKLFVTTFATAFVMALALPAVAQSVCGASGTAGMPSCTSARSGVACCIPPRAQIANKGGKKGKTIALAAQPTIHEHQVAAVVDDRTGNSGGNGNGPVVPAVNKVTNAPAAQTVSEKSTGGTGAGVGTGAAPAAPAAQAAAPAAAAAAPAAAAAASSAKAASAGASRGGGAAAKGARR